MKTFKEEMKSDLKVFFWSMIILGVLYIQGLGIQLLLSSLGINL